MRRSVFGISLLMVSALFVPGIAGAQAPATPPPPAPSAQAPAPQSAPPAQVQAAVDRVQAFYDKTQTFRSKFEQEFLVKAYNQKKTSTGTVTIQKPGMMDWTYDSPAGNRVVSDGKTIKVYEAANHQMYEQPIDKSQYPAALSFLTGTGKLGDTFNFSLFSGEQMNFPGGQVLVGTPKVATPAYQKVFFYIDMQTAQVRRVMVLDGQGNRNRFAFIEPRVNEKVAPETFVFTPPAGTQIVRP